MRLVLLARRGSPVVHFAGLHATTASSFCGSLSLTAVDLKRRPSADSPWWFGSPTEAADERILDRRRPCFGCVRVLEQWAVELVEALARHGIGGDT